MPQKRKTEEGESRPIDLVELKQQIRKELKNRYGNVSRFINSEDGKMLGGDKIRPLLYDKGSVSFKLLKDLCEFLNMGELSREIHKEVTCSYTIKK